MVMLALLVALGSGAAMAKTSNGPDGIAGTKKADKMDGRAGNDYLWGDRGGVRMVGGPGAGRVFGDSGNDTMDLTDGERDEVDCGEGDKDRVIFDGLDAAASGTLADTGNCEIFEAKGGAENQQ
jgi:Ca2+-binding RTX toxin-like protein